MKLSLMILLLILSVQSLLIEILLRLEHVQNAGKINKPQWVWKIEEVLNDRFAETLTLDYLAQIAGIHPVHLSRDFSKYFHCGLGAYIRKIRVEKALALISQQKMSLTQVAVECGFFDQSHFTRCFLELNGITPSVHKKIFFKQ